MSAQILCGPKLENTIKDKSLGSFLFNQSIKYGDRLCQIDGTLNKSETYSSVRERSVRVALQFQKRGITSEDIVGFCSVNTLDNTIPLIAATFLGAKIANFEPTLSVRHTKHLLLIVQPKLIFVEENALPLIEESLSQAGLEADIIVFGNSENYPTFSSLLHEQENEDKFTPTEVDSNDLAALFFSSGTTGVPKAICHSHNGFLRSIETTCQVAVGEAMLHFSTFYWQTALTVLFCCFASGSCRVFCRNSSTENIFQIIEKHKVTFIFSNPVLTYKLTDFEKSSNYNTSSLKLFVVGGSPLPSHQLSKLRQLFKDTLVVLAYGLSEIGFVTPSLSADDQKTLLTNTTTVGRVLGNLKIKVADLITGELLGPNVQGEIRVSSPSIMRGYYKGDTTDWVDEDGFLKTGDVGYCDSDGFLYVIGRIKESFKYQNWRIIPFVIESALIEHPGIKEAAVFGLPHEVDRDVPSACLVLHKGYDLNKNDIDEFLKTKVADYERLRGEVIFVDSLPKTPTGKVIRSELKNFAMNLKNSQQ